MNYKKQCEAKKLPPLILKRKVSGTVYIVSSRFNEKATEDITAKVKRLILSDTSNG